MFMPKLGPIDFTKCTLALPDEKYQSSYESYINELGDEERYPYPLDLPHDDFNQLIQLLHNYSQGKSLPDWMVPNTTFWLMSNEEILGCAHLRHHLNDELKHAGGHIGLGIRPSARGKGLGQYLLQKTIIEAQSKGIDKVHIHCYKNNQSSISMIESVGGQLQSSDYLEAVNQRVLRFICR